MESRVLGVRFDVVDSYAWHGTVDEISKQRSSLLSPSTFSVRPMGLESESSFV